MLICGLIGSVINLIWTAANPDYINAPTFYGWMWWVFLIIGLLMEAIFFVATMRHKK